MNLFDPTLAASAVTAVEQPLLFQHFRIDMAQGKVLGEDALRLERLQGQESVSDLFEYQLEVHGDTDDSGVQLEYHKIIGRPITVGIGNAAYDSASAGQIAFRKALDGTGPQGAFALINGIVASFGIDVPGVYRITVRPAAWRMSLTNRYRIFAGKSICDVLTQLCREHGVEASFSGLQGSDNLASCRVQDWLQAGESDLDLMRRLMAKAHIYFYFRHEAGRHVMVFDNRAVYPTAIPNNTPLRYTYTGIDALGLHQGDTVTQYSYQESLGTSGVQGVFTVQTEAWDVRQPGEPLATFSSFRADSQPDTGDLPFHQYKILQYGFSDAQAREFVQATAAAMCGADAQFSGASLCTSLRPGYRFRMTGSVRPELTGVDFVITQVQHTATLDGEYSNQFSATLASTLISQTGLQDTQQGMVLAHVTTPGGDDAVQNWPYYIPDDFSLGRAEYQDSQGVPKRLNAKGVYVRFSCDPPDAKPVWVKLAPHMQTIPEVGCSVWVSRGNDESELPEIQNMVQADGTKTITDSGWTAHSSVGNSFSTSYGDSRSIRFGQPWSRGDVDAAVKLVEDAYARKVFRDASYSRGGNYGYSTTEQAEKGMLSESWSYGSTYSNSWSLEQRSFGASGTSHHQSVVGKSDPAQVQPETLSGEAAAAVQSSRSTVFGNTYSWSQSNGDTKSVATYNGKVESESTHNGNVSSATTITGVTSNTSTHTGNVDSTNTITGNSNSTSTINGNSISTSTITGLTSNTSVHSIVHNTTTIAAQSSSSAIGASNSNDAIGVSNTNSAVGLTNRNSATGASIDLSVQGSGNAISATGIETRVSATGMNNTVSAVGESNSVSVVGSSTSVEIAGPGAQLSIKSDQAKIDLDGPVMQIPVIVLVL